MATTQVGPTSRVSPPRRDTSGASGIVAFAGVLMLLTGVLHAIQGIVALVNDTFFVVGGEYVFELDMTSWGWIHLVAGIVVAAAGIGLFSGATWARLVAVVLASLSLVASFVWLPFYPFWSLLVIGLDLAVLWAVVVRGRV